MDFLKKMWRATLRFLKKHWLDILVILGLGALIVWGSSTIAARFKFPKRWAVFRKYVIDDKGYTDLIRGIKKILGTEKTAAPTVVAGGINPLLERGFLFLEDGRLLAAGTHDELYETCGEYRRVVDLQKLEEEGGTDHA